MERPIIPPPTINTSVVIISASPNIYVGKITTETQRYGERHKISPYRYTVTAAIPLLPYDTGFVADKRCHRLILYVSVPPWLNLHYSNGNANNGEKWVFYNPHVRLTVRFLRLT